MADIHPDHASVSEKLDESRKPSLSPRDDERTAQLERGPTTLAGGLLLNEDEALTKARSGSTPDIPIYVTFAKDDPENPRNFPRFKKWYITCFASWLNVITCLCAGGYSSAADDISEHFNVSAEVATLGLSMYILGFALGPMLLAPLSEYFGRSPVYISSWFFLVSDSFHSSHADQQLISHA